MLNAGKLIKREFPEKLSLEYFDLKSITWKDFNDVEVFIEKESYEKGAFLDAFKATSSNNLSEQWAIKMHIHESQETMQALLDITSIDPTMKQC